MHDAIDEEVSERSNLCQTFLSFYISARSEVGGPPTIFTMDETAESRLQGDETREDVVHR